MNPVALFQHDKTQRPGYLLDVLKRRGIETRLIRPAEGDDVPRSAEGFGGLVFLGSNRSVNDPLPWIGRELALMRDALARDVPVLGHCFGGQLLARALGAPVACHATPNIGWDTLHVTPGAAPWFGRRTEVTTFNWHFETFALPQGATRTLFGTHCLNKGFAYGRHLGFQCHLEVTEDIVREWCAEGRGEIAACRSAAVQAPDDILADLPARLARLHDTAQAVYAQWLSHLPVSAARLT